MSSSSTNNRMLRERLPHPIAAAYDRSMRTSEGAARVKQLLGTLDVFLRLTSGWLLSDYLRGPVNDKIEALLPNFDRKPSLGHYRALIRELALHNCTRPDAFFPEISYWHFKSNGKPSDQAKLLDDLITERNRDGHGQARNETELLEFSKSMEIKLQRVLAGASWLMSYRLFRASEISPTRGGGFKGKLHFYCGRFPHPEPLSGKWTAQLYDDAVYVVSADGTRILETSPYLSVLPNGREQCLFLWISSPKGRRLDLRNDDTAIELKLLPRIAEDEVPYSQWLEQREKLEPAVSNELSKHLAQESWVSNDELLDNRYRIVQKLGEGGMAVVYAAEDTFLDEEVALKILHTEHSDPRLTERLKRELKLMKRLQHTNILVMEDCIALQDGRLALRMPVMQGTLKDRLQEGPQELVEVSRWAEQALAALNYLHEEGVVHRDIKPSNFLLDSNQNLKLSDFGIAKGEDDIRLTRTNENMGSWPYMAPELRKGTGTAGAASDRYSLAVTLHELVREELSEQPGTGIEGAFGGFIRQLGAEDPAARMAATWSVRPDDNPNQISSTSVTTPARQPSQPTPNTATESRSQPEQAQQVAIFDGQDYGTKSQFLESLNLTMLRAISQEIDPEKFNNLNRALPKYELVPLLESYTWTKINHVVMACGLAEEATAKALKIGQNKPKKKKKKKKPKKKGGWFSNLF